MPVGISAQGCAQANQGVLGWIQASLAESTSKSSSLEPKHSMQQLVQSRDALGGECMSYSGIDCSVGVLEMYF